jgi:hypothetical protein
LGFLGAGLFLISSPAWFLSENIVAQGAVVGLAGAVIGYAVTALVSEALNPTYDAVIEAFKLNQDQHVENNFRNMIHREVASAVAEVTSSSVDFGPRARLFSALELHLSEESVHIQSISLSQKWQTTQILEDLFSRRPRLQVRILLVHPYSKHVEMRESDLGFQPNTIRQLLEETILPLASLAKRQSVGDRIQVRGYFATPYYGLISYDSRRALVTLSREGRGGDQNYGLLIEGSTQAATAMIEDLNRGFDDRWNDSFDLLNPLNVTIQLESSSDDVNFVVRLDSDTALDANSIVLDISNGTLTESATSDLRSHRFTIVGDGGNASLIRVRLERAFSSDHHYWLHRPIELLLGGSHSR